MIKYLFSYWYTTGDGGTGVGNVIVDVHGDATLDTYLRVQASIERDLMIKTGDKRARATIIAFSRFAKGVRE